MNTTNINVLKSFYSVTNRNILTEEVYNILLKRWDLDKVDLNNEIIKINAHQSSLSKSRRAAIPEFIKLREMLNKKKETEDNSISMNSSEENNDEVVIGNDDLITNQFQVDSMSEIS